MKDWQSTLEIYAILSEIVIPVSQDDENDRSEGKNINSSFSAVKEDEAAAAYKQHASDLISTLERNRTSVTIDTEIENSSKLV